MIFLKYLLNKIFFQMSLLIVFIISIYSKSLSFFKYLYSLQVSIIIVGSLLVLLFLSLYYLYSLDMFTSNAFFFNNKLTDLELNNLRLQLFKVTTPLISDLSLHFSNDLEKIAKLYYVPNSLLLHYLEEFNNNLIIFQNKAITRFIGNIIYLKDFNGADILLQKRISEYSHLLESTAKKNFIFEIKNNSWSFFFADCFLKIKSLF